MRSSIVRSVAAALLVLLAWSAPAAAAVAVCGNGILDHNEECDPGGPLFCNGDPAAGACTTGAQCANGVNCYFATGCCKFNCQFVGQGADCFDGNACTANDRCDNVGRCLGQFVPDGDVCDDGVFCNGTDTCASGACSGHGGDPCAANTDCLATCDEDDDTCVSTPFVPCGDDGNACTDDLCNSVAVCTHPPRSAGTTCRAAATVCDVGETCDGSGAPCPADALVPNGTSCGDQCTTGGTCQQGACAGGSPLECDDDDVCNGLETCDSLLGCQPGEALDCDDQEPCTADTCDAANGCAHAPAPDGAPCEDGDQCSGLDLCLDDVCVPGPTFVGKRRAKVVNDATVNRDFAAFDARAVASLGKSGFMPDGTTVSGDRVKIGKGASVADVAANALTSIGAEIRGTQGPVTVPLASEFCAIDPVVCGGPDVVVPPLGVATLEPGTYGNARIGEGAIANLKPGTYTFCGFQTGNGVQITFLGSTPSFVRVARLFKLGNQSIYGPAAGVPWPTLHADSGLVKIGADGFATTHIVAPDAKVKVLRGTLFDGGVCAKDLKGAWHVTLSCTE